MTPRPGRIVLIGFMGSGKSMVGRLLATRLGYHFADTDALVVDREGASIARIFAERGEPAFREAESAVLEHLAHHRKIVVATGGGVPAQPRNAWFFTGDTAGIAVFHLRVSLAAARDRTRNDRGRPLLSRGDAEVRELYDQRIPLYERLGTAIETDDRTPEAVAGEIIEILGSPTRRHPPAGNA
jgi:shikimate kinase